MCGLGAIARSHPDPDPLNARRRQNACLEALARRGPDGAGELTICSGRVTLLHRRLSIQDLGARAAQPMTSMDGSVSLVFNGEIYNVVELRTKLERQGARFNTRSDTEVLLHALRLWGLADTLEMLRGMFAFVAIRQHGTQIDIEAAVDHVAMKPLLWSFEHSAKSGPTLSIASDADALMALLPRRPGLDPVGLCHVLSVGYCPQPLTMWQGIHALRPGHVMRWRVGETHGPQVARWWQPPESAHASTRHADAAFDFRQTFEHVVHEHLVGDVPIGMFLSAGLDSSAVALALHSRKAGHDLPIAYSLTSGGPDDESTDARALATALGMRHETIRLEAPELSDAVRLTARTFDQPQGYSALLTATCLARGLRASEIGRDVKVVLGGDGGDEAFAGYAWHGDPFTHPLSLGAFTPVSPTEHAALASGVGSPDATPAERMAAGLALGSLSYTHRYVRRLFNGFHPRESAALLQSLAPEYDENTYAAFLLDDDRPSLAHPRRVQRLDTVGFCAGSINAKVDRACMGVGLELRAPFLDRRILEHGLALPVVNGEPPKAPIRAYLHEAVMKGLIPERVLTRPKQGFSLRLPRTAGTPGPMSTLRTLIDDSRFVRDGLLRRDYDRFFPSDDEGREVRWFTLAMLAAWYDQRC
jgi:asparagine synthase (glutamine-hydrolysing)